MEKKKILIVDDEEGIRQLVRRMLGDEHLVLEAIDGQMAIDMAHEQNPDIILMDIMMPRKDGNLACFEIKNDPFTKAIPVVMLTIVGYELNKEFAEQMGASGYITKPFTVNTLKAMIDQFLGLE